MVGRLPQGCEARWREPDSHGRHHHLRSIHARQEAAISQVIVEGPNDLL